MASTKLNPRPIWEERRRLSYWIKLQCNDQCPGHIIPFDKINVVGGHQIIYPIDLNQWNIVCEQELQVYKDVVNPDPKDKKPKEYKSPNKRRKSIKIFGKLS